MKFGVCTANYVGRELMRFIGKQEQRPCYVVTNSSDAYEDAIAGICRMHEIPCHRGMDVNSSEFIVLNRTHEIDFVLLLWWPVIIRKPALKSVRRGFINLHPSLLPYNRGMNPYYWSIVDGTPAGVSIHWIDEQVDHGAVLFQKELDVPITETGEHLYARATEAMIELFTSNFERILKLDGDAIPENNILIRVHKVRDMVEHSRIDLNRLYRAGDLINILRARTFTNGDSAYFQHQGRKYNIRVSIEDAGESEMSGESKEALTDKAHAYADSKS